MSETLEPRKITKAGIILFDRGEMPPAPTGEKPKWQKKPVVKVLTSYTQGRFDDNGIYLVPPKGSIDPLKNADKTPKLDAEGQIIYEEPIIAAIRECREETGVDIEKLLGDHYADFLAGKTIEHVTNSGYPGVEIVSASATPVDEHTYVSGHGSGHRAQYFAVEIRGIENLRGELKSIVPGEHALKPEDRKLSNELAVEKGMPSFNQMMKILRTGVVPVVEGAVWSNAEPQRIFEKPKLKKLEKNWLESHARDHEHLRHDEWLEFIKDPILGSTYKKIQANLEALKYYLEEKNLVGDCDGCLKLDTKDRPLTFYKEGGHIAPIDETLRDMETMAQKNETYARAVWGEYSGPKIPDVDEAAQMERAQIKPFIDFLAKLSPMAIASAAMPGTRVLHGELLPRAMRAVDGIANPVAHSKEWGDKVRGETSRANGIV